MVSAGLLFKVAAVPFHMWTPDVYQGSPTPVTAFMAAAVKVAGFGALLRVMYVALGGASWDWEPVMWVVAILTMLVGVILAVTSSDIKRMLAYSSVGHAGFLLLGVIAFSTEGLAATMFYLLAYGLTTIGCFAIVMLVRGPAGEAGHLSSWAGLGRTSPLIAGVFAFLLLALAGIPLTSGFTAKFGIFSAAIASGAVWPVIFAVIASAISAFFYLKVIVLMYFAKPGGRWRGRRGGPQPVHAVRDRDRRARHGPAGRVPAGDPEPGQRVRDLHPLNRRRLCGPAPTLRNGSDPSVSAR